MSQKPNETRAGRILSALYRLKGLDDGAVDKTSLFARLQATRRRRMPSRWWREGDR